MFNKYFVVVLAIICPQVFGQASMGPLKVDLIESRYCDGDTGIVKLEIISINSEQKGFNFDLDIDYPLDESVSYYVRVDQVDNGMIRENVFNYNGPNACEELQQFLGELWNKIVSLSGMPEGCPKEAGHYQANGFEYHDEDMGVDDFFIGRYILNMMIKKDNALVACIVIEFQNNE